MNIESWKFSLSLVAAVFIGSLAGSAFIYQDMNSEIDSLKDKVANSTSTRLVYVNGTDGSLHPVFEKVDQSVVYIEARGDKSTQGSGFVYSQKGYIITNEHVVDDADTVTVSFTDGTTRKAEIVGTDPYTDLAVLKVDKAGLKPLELANSSQVVTGQRAIAVSNPYGFRGSLTAGFVSQVGRSLPVQEVGLEGFRIRNVIQTDAAINPGSSGSPLLNKYGEVIGVNTAIETQTGGFSGIGFAVPSNTVKRVVPDIIKSGDAKHPWIGVTGRDMNRKLAKIMNTTQETGFLVMNVSRNSPASRAGLQGGNRTVKINGLRYIIGGDIIVGMGGERMRDIEDIKNFLATEADVGETVKITVQRNGKEVTMPLTLADRPDDRLPPAQR
ncbi:MAG: S1C family serine protease [Candidatus Nanohalobium sp.]